MIGGSGRVVGPVIVVAVTLTVLIAGCGPSPATPSLGPSPTGSLAPPATAEGPSPSAVASGAAVQVDAALLAFVPAAVDGVPLTFDPGTSATIAADPSVAPDAASLAVALAIVPGASAADDLAVVSVVRLRDPAKDETWFRDWRDTYDQAACSPAGGLVGNAEAEIGGGTVYIGSCAGGVRTYHTRLAAAGIVVSITALGSRRLGEKVMAGLKR
ncbi:MAG TPA: hypothetical protein VK233_09080 [Candidatus Dormibacteraeota bacterium]|nr:hypothetical protein [Candidatus Dormibacteraeota bacterium]